MELFVFLWKKAIEMDDLYHQMEVFFLWKKTIKMGDLYPQMEVGFCGKKPLKWMRTGGTFIYIYKETSKWSNRMKQLAGAKCRE